MCLSLLYFLSGYFPLKFDEFINKGISKELFRDMSVYAKEREESKIWLCAAGLILFYSLLDGKKQKIVFIDDDLGTFKDIIYCHSKY